MANSQDTLNPSARLAPAINRAGQHLAGKHSTRSVAGVTLTMPPDHDVVEIKGMSMAPELRGGMLVLVDRRHRIARLSGYDFLLQFLYTAALGTMTEEQRKATLAQIAKLNEGRHGPTAVAGLTNDPASARMFAQAKFTADNFVDRLRRDFGIK